ncbi:MAG: DUF4173 domain-containing protein [Lachnospiraceae bacterium]|nr:DUF4173 domain-containing protein [Lachnospiraceae bacterium]
MSENIQTVSTLQASETAQTTQNTSNDGQAVQQEWWQRPEPQTLYQEKVKENFHIFGISTFLYACLYAFCMYRNESGVAFSFFVAGSLVYICFCLSKLGITWKKDNGFYMISMVLLSVSTFCTDDERIIFFNKLGVFLLTISMLLSIVYDTKKWNLGKYLSAICGSCMLALGQLGTPLADAVWYCKNKLDKKNSKYLYVLVGLVITIPLFVVVFLLLTSADVVFRDMADSLLDGFDFGDIVAVAWMTCLMFFACYCMLVQFCKKTLKEEVTDQRRGEPLIAIPVVTVLSLLYLVFSGVQILYLFVGNMELPAGYTYAEYAREGFFQLLTVGILNLIIVLVCLYYFKAHKLLKIVLTIMSACTFIMLASSAMRMIIYIQYYYMTFLRILVLWSLAVLFLIFAGVLIYTHKESFPLFRYSMVIVTCFYLILSFGHPDYWIAKVNVESMQENRSDFFKGEAYDDYRYLATLNADAAPVLLKLLDDRKYDLNYYYICEESDECYSKSSEIGFGYCWLEYMHERTEDMSLRKFNVSRFLMEQNLLGRVTEGM